MVHFGFFPFGELRLCVVLKHTDTYSKRNASPIHAYRLRLHALNVHTVRKCIGPLFLLGKLNQIARYICFVCFSSSFTHTLSLSPSFTQPIYLSLSSPGSCDIPQICECVYASQLMGSLYFFCVRWVVVSGSIVIPKIDLPSMHFQCFHAHLTKENWRKRNGRRKYVLNRSIQAMEQRPFKSIDLYA